MPHITQLSLDHLDALARHMGVHAAESGRDGDPVFMPWGRERPLSLADFRARRRRSWAQALDVPTWSRAWGLWEDGQIVGHAELVGGGIPAAAHRASLGMGLERPWRGRGHGAALLRTVLEWARAERRIDWIDLGVFARNERAQALYRRFGFAESGRIDDRYRVDGESIDDISMALFVGARPGAAPDPGARTAGRDAG